MHVSAVTQHVPLGGPKVRSTHNCLNDLRGFNALHDMLNSIVLHAGIIYAIDSSPVHSLIDRICEHMVEPGLISHLSQALVQHWCWLQ